MDKRELDGFGLDDDRWWKSVAELARPITGSKGGAAGKKLVSAIRSGSGPMGRVGGCSEHVHIQEVSAVTTQGVAVGGQVRRRVSPGGLYACTEESGLFSSIDAGTKARVDRGKYPIDKVIDLHGHSEASARDSLVEFVKSSFQSGHRCIRVITGWGSKNSGNNSIKSNLHRWLQLDSIVDMVLYYRQAIPAHGGKGAFYILLRTNKKA
ncbi:Smr domain-containing protein [Anaplasma centrale str. Israel]|uniref:Smr domain-containing protein n=1 Tax=Anaplasma centrale (strain Israel) TaxID=574556 RepID=D1ASD4_ANACI|nr:Smr/MutS family protein [Anaplasma centrale]ACZ49387.1 Smr domain-containing protein [Anaplasma centrale str. Israel]